MRNTKWLALLVGLFAVGLIAVGCGDDSSTSSTPATSSEESTSDTSSEDTSSSDSGSVDAEGVYNACIDVIEGTPAEETAKTACEQARTGFEQCAQQAEAAGGSAAEAALKICQDAADQTIAALQSSG